MNKSSFIKDGEIVASIDASLFPKEVIIKTLYWFGDKFHTNISLVGNNFYSVSLKPLQSANLKDEDLELYLQKFERDLIDFELRSIVTRETQNIRELLVAKAFSNGEFDDTPPGNVSDAVGFNPSF